MLSTTNLQNNIFIETTRDAFKFLENEYDMKLTRFKEFKGDPRDSGIVARYRNDKLIIDIGWNKFDLSLVISIYFKNSDLEHKQRYIYFEPFIEFYTNGKVLPIIPPVYSKMSIAQIEELMNKRAILFSGGLTEIIMQLASRLYKHFNKILNVSPNAILEYHSYFGN